MPDLAQQIEFTVWGPFFSAYATTYLKVIHTVPSSGTSTAEFFAMFKDETMKRLRSCSQLPCFSHSKMPSLHRKCRTRPAPLIAECDRKWSPENG